MYKSLVIVYSDSISKNKEVLFVNKIDIIIVFFELNIQGNIIGF